MAEHMGEFKNEVTQIYVFHLSVPWYLKRQQVKEPSQLFAFLKV